MDVKGLGIYMSNQLSLRLSQLSEKFQAKHIHDLFRQDSDRYQQFHVKANGLLLDFSKQRLDHEVLTELIHLADSKQLSNWMDKLFSCDTVNHTEGRSAMHWALREPKQEDSSNSYNALVHEQLDKMSILVDKIRSGQLRGVTGEKITDVVNIGVGGSDLGPLMVCHALASTRIKPSVKVHFASTMDGSQLSQIIQKMNPASTLFIISSKSFTTIDTLSNAETAKKWMIRHLGDTSALMRCHFVGVSTRSDKMTDWGISTELQLNLWDWVGGRYSLWSAIGLPIAISLGMDQFRCLLQGAYEMDEHFKHTPWEKNLPVLLALIGVWNTNFLEIQTHAVLPYDGRLEYLTSYLQQLEMESNGKSIKRNNSPVDYATCPILWGEVGPNAQHAFYQLLHQGTLTVSTDFIIAKQRDYSEQSDLNSQKHFSALQQQHQLAIANCLAQSRLLAFGNAAVANVDLTTTPVYRQYRGNKPSSTLVLPILDAYYLGALIAAYEHKVFVQSVIWDINPFDQWGVEMGKTIAQEILPFLSGKDIPEYLDQSTQGLLVEFLDAGQS